MLFIEISDFAALSATVEASQLVSLLNFVFTTFDDALEAFGSAVYKVETVGPVYVVSAGVPEPRPDHCEALTLLALSLHDKLDEAGGSLRTSTRPTLNLRRLLRVTV